MERRVYGNLLSSHATVYGAFTSAGSFTKAEQVRQRNEAVVGRSVVVPWACWGGEWAESSSTCLATVAKTNVVNGRVSYSITFARELNYAPLIVSWEELSGRRDVGNGRLKLAHAEAADTLDHSFFYGEILLFFSMQHPTHHSLEQLVFVRWLERASGATALLGEEGDAEGSEGASQSRCQSDEDEMSSGAGPKRQRSTPAASQASGLPRQERHPLLVLHFTPQGASPGSKEEASESDDDEWDEEDESTVCEAASQHHPLDHPAPPFSSTCGIGVR